MTVVHRSEAIQAPDGPGVLLELRKPLEYRYAVCERATGNLVRWDESSSATRQLD